MVAFYLWNPSATYLLFLGSILSFTVSYFFGALMEQFNMKNKTLLSLAFLFMALSFFLFISGWYIYAPSESKLFPVGIQMLLWSPFYLLSARALLRAYTRVNLDGDNRPDVD